MKTTRLFLASLVFLGITTAKAQWQLAGNANATSTSFIGTTAANPAAGQDITFKRAGITAGKLQTTTTSFGVNSLAMPNSVSIGVGAGQFSSGTGFNTYIGQNAGKGLNVVGQNNTGNYNTFIGYDSGRFNMKGNGNIAIGTNSGKNNDGNGNIFIGNNTGCEDSAMGDNNIYIGNGSGFTECGSNVLVIDNAGETDRAFIWGDMQNDLLKFHAKVAIGGTGTLNFGNFPTTAASVNVANYNLFVKGGILTEEVRVSLASTWADYVFAKDYKLKPLSEVERFINNNGHLPNVPSAKQVKEEGVELGEMAKIQQEKIEELTLYVIEQNKINESQAKEIEVLKAQMKAILERQ